METWELEKNHENAVGLLTVCMKATYKASKISCSQKIPLIEALFVFDRNSNTLASSVFSLISPPMTYIDRDLRITYFKYMH